MHVLVQICCYHGSNSRETCVIVCSFSTVQALFTSSITFVNAFIISLVTDNWLTSISDKETYLENSSLILLIVKNLANKY